MAKIKSEEMARAMSQNPHISIKKSLFGLSQKIVYEPTGSNVNTFVHDYPTDTGELIKRLLNAPADKLGSLVQATNLGTPGVGPARLEGCVSDDGQFAAYLVSGYSDFEYRPLMEVKVYEGEQAQVISQVLR